MPADIVTNVRHLAGMIDDIELVLFEADEIANLPSVDDIQALAAMAKEYGMSYTVHFPLDAHLGHTDAARRQSDVQKCERIISLTKPLNPFAYPVHFNGVEDSGTDDQDKWLDSLHRSAEDLCKTGIHPSLFCIETLSYPFELVSHIVDEFSFSVCIDTGHVDLLDRDPVAELERYLEKTRIIHLHGVSEGKDHRSLEYMASAQLNALLELAGRDTGSDRLVTLEVFNEADFESSLTVLESL